LYDVRFCMAQSLTAVTIGSIRRPHILILYIAVRTRFLLAIFEESYVNGFH